MEHKQPVNSLNYSLKAEKGLYQWVQLPSHRKDAVQGEGHTASYSSPSPVGSLCQKACCPC